MKKLILFLLLIGYVVINAQAVEHGLDLNHKPRPSRVDTNGLKSVNDLYFEIAQDNLTGYNSEFKFGRNEGVGAVEEVVWDGGGSYTFLETAEYLKVVSDSAADDFLGTGARTIVIFGLDADYVQQSETIEMDGTDTVQTVNKYLRTFRALVLTSGTNDPIDDANKGTVKFLSDSTLILQAQIQEHNGQTLMAVYTVPAGKTGYVTAVSFAVGEGKQCLFKGKFRNGVTSDFAFSVKYVLDLFQTSFFGTLVVPLMVPEKTDIVLTAQSSAAGTDAGASFGMILVDN